MFDKIDISDKKEKFRNLENEAKQKTVHLELNRRKSTGGILKKSRKKSLSWNEEEIIHSYTYSDYLQNRMPDPKFHDQKDIYNRRNQPDSNQERSRRRSSGSSDRGLTSPPPISLGRRVEVDLKEKQKKFEGLDKNAEEQSAVLIGKARPKSWGPGEIRKALEKQGSVDVAFKDKHQNYEKLQRQATTESAVLEGKLRPQADRDGRPQKVILGGRSDVKLREKQKDFERRDYQAQREKAVLEGKLRTSAVDGKEIRENPVMIPKREQIKLGEKKATFEQLDKQAEQDSSILRGQYKPSPTDTGSLKRSSRVGLPRDANVGLLEKQRTFEEKDSQAKKESEILEKNKRNSYGSPVKEPTPLSTSTRPRIDGFQSSLDRKKDASDVTRRNQQERPSRPVSNYYDYSSYNDYPKANGVDEISASTEGIYQVSAEEPVESLPSVGYERVNTRQNERGFSAEQNNSTNRNGEYSDYVKRRYEESKRRHASAEEPVEINLTDAKNLSYRDLVRAPRKKSRETFIREKNTVVPAEEMPWRKEVREVKEKRHLYSDEEQDASYGPRPTSPRSDLGKAQYLELVAPPSKKKVYTSDGEKKSAGENALEMPWRKEVRDRRSASDEEPQPSNSELTRIRPPSLKTRDAFVTTGNDKDADEMPWRKEVRELKERPRAEDDLEYQGDKPSPELDPSPSPNFRKMSYKEFINVPSKKRREVFQAQLQKEEEEMPWRKEVREIKKSMAEDEEGEYQKTSATLAHSAPEHNDRKLDYKDFSPKLTRKAKEGFLVSQDKEEEEMPWRKEVREMKRSVLEDEPVKRSSATNVHSSQEATRDYRKLSYRDFVARPRKKSFESFLSSEEKEKEEMPWRKEVRELKYRPPDDEEIKQSSRSELQSSNDDSFHNIRDHPTKRATEGERQRSRNEPYHVHPAGVGNMSYNDFACPPSKTDQLQGQAQRKTRVKDLTRKFTDIEAENTLPRKGGPPARKSLVDIGELKRIEREMRTKSWHGIPDDYDSDDDYERRRTRSEEEAEERVRQHYHRENISGMEELDDVFQDPEGYFDQIRAPPPEKFNGVVAEEVPVQHSAPSWNERDDRGLQVVTVRSADDHDYNRYDIHEQPSSFSISSEGYYDKSTVRDGYLSKNTPSDDRVVVKQTWIQPNRVELPEASPNPPEHEGRKNVHREYVERDEGQFLPQPYKDERSYQRDYMKRIPFQPNVDYHRNDETFLSRGVDLNEEKCFIDESYYTEQNQPYYPGGYDYRGRNQGQMDNEDWKQRVVRLDPREHRNQPAKVSVKGDNAMVFGSPIMVTAKPRPQQLTQNEGQGDYRQKQSGVYDFLPVEERFLNDRDVIPTKKESSYSNRNTVESIPSDKEQMENARRRLLQDIKHRGENGVIKPPQEPRMPSRPQVFGVFARTDQRITYNLDDMREGQPSNLPQKELEYNFQEHRLRDVQDSLQGFTEGVDRQGVTLYMERRLQQDGEGYDYENIASSQTELHPVVVSAVESQTRRWGDGAFEASPSKDENRAGRGRVMNFSHDQEEEMHEGQKKEGTNVIGDGTVVYAAAEPVQREGYDADRKREQRQKEEMVKEQLRDAEYREKYRREFEEKNRKQRENSKYLMSQLQMTMDGEEDYEDETERPRNDEIGERREIPPKKSHSSDDEILKAVAAEEDDWQRKLNKKAESEKKETRRSEPPRRVDSSDSLTRINGIDFVSEENVVLREKKSFEQEEHLRKLRAEEESMVQEAERQMKKRATLKQQTQADEVTITPVEKPPVEFSINEEMFADFQAEEKHNKHVYDENRNYNGPNTETSFQRNGYYNDEEYKPPKQLEHQDEERHYSDYISKPQAEVLPTNGHFESDVQNKTRAELLRENGDQYQQDNFPENSDAAPEVNGFEGYSIYETFIHGESNHVVCASCGTSIEKSPSMYIAELDRYWHVNCFSCVVCRAWFGDEYSPVLHITNSMLHCERCYITDEGERCTEV